MPRAPQRRLSYALFAVAFALAGTAPLSSHAGAQTSGDLVGTFAISAGSCSGGPSGSYFRMVHPTGSAAGGPFVDNGDSSCADRTYTLLAPGGDGGLVTGGYQPAPSPGFDGDGNSLAKRLFQPVGFFNVKFSGSTNPTDLQTNQAVPAPSVRADGGQLSGDLSAFVATWNDQAFNQGSPKPGGARPGNTAPVSGTYDAATGAYTLSWASQIVGGPFNNFTGVWHLEGTFRPAGAAAPSVPSGGGSTPTGSGTAGSPGQPTTDVTTAEPTQVSDGEAQVPVAAGDEELALASVTDDGFEAPTWLVLLLAALGIGGVVTLVVLPRRSPEDLTA